MRKEESGYGCSLFFWIGGRYEYAVCIEDIFDLVNYESENYEGLERAFHEAVDDYLAFREEV